MNLKKMIKVRLKKRVFSLQDAAAYFDVSRGTVNNWCKKGRLPFLELPGRGNERKIIRICFEDLLEFEAKYYRHSVELKNLVKQNDAEMILLPRNT